MKTEHGIELSVYRPYKQNAIIIIQCGENYTPLNDLGFGEQRAAFDKREQAGNKKVVEVVENVHILSYDELKLHLDNEKNQ